MSEGSERATSEERGKGYTYWKREIPDAHVLPSCVPQKIDKSSSEESLVDSFGEKKLMSRWNSGTTYEERNITERAKKMLILLISEIEHPRLVFTQSTFSGEVHAHAVRGKVKIGYELTELNLKMKTKAGDSCGSIQLEDLDSTDPEAFIITLVDGKGDILKSEAKTLVIQLMDNMCTRLLAE